MDIIEILVLISLFGLPLLQQLLGRKSEEADSDLDVGRDEHPLPEPVATRSGERPSLESDWSAGWGAWPEPDEKFGPESVTDADLPQEDVVEPRPKRIYVAEEEPLVISLEPVEYDRDSYRTVRARTPLDQPRKYSRSGRVDRFVKDRSALREAVIVSEILGPPAALRPPLDRRPL